MGMDIYARLLASAHRGIRHPDVLPYSEVKQYWNQLPAHERDSYRAELHNVLMDYIYEQGRKRSGW